MQLTNTKKSVAQILKLHGEILDAARTSLPKAIKIGELLAGIKNKLEHGQWLPWIQKNLSFSERTAQNYLRFFEEKDRLKNAAIADFPLSVSGALALLSEPKASPELPLDAANEARAAELDAKIKDSLANTKAAFADVPRSEFPEDWIDLAAYEEFFKSGGQSLGTTLTPADEDGFNTLGICIAAGAIVSKEIVLDWLRRFNPAREMETVA